MNVSDAMTPRSEVITAEIPGSREDVLVSLQERGFSSVPAIKRTDDGEQFRGLITRESLIEQPDEDQLALLVREVPTIEPDASIEELTARIRASGERRIPVLEDDELVGMVTVTDIVRAIAEGAVNGSVAVGELATDRVNTVYTKTPLPVAERELSYADVPYGVVLDDAADPVGMITEVDIIEVARVVQGEANPGDAVANQDDEWMWEGIKAVGSRSVPTLNVEIPDEDVSEFMTADLLTVSKTKTARETAQLMIDNDVEQIPLVTGGSLTGIIRDVDLLRGI